METRIAVLPKDLADKIAAGEVIERPASILKELLENAFDAGATDIIIELEEGGRDLIRIIDNGAGIRADDVESAFERHATSKIRNLEDIYRIGSFGFRGEALPSIAAVSDLEMLTRRRGELSGVRVLVESGRIKEVSAAGCPEGTSITVRNIFGSIPARRKFLKRQSVEQGYCLDVATRLALAQPGIKVKVLSRGKTVLNVPRAVDFAERISLILGMDFGRKIIPVKASRNGIGIEGYISRPDFTRTSTKSIYLYVNRRYVRDHLISHAVMNAYRGLIEARKYPAVVIFIDVPPEEVDVNVHPAKTEVRFRDSKVIYETVLEALAVGLSGAPPRSPSIVEAEPRSERPLQSNESPRRYIVSTGPDKPVFGPPPPRTSYSSYRPQFPGQRRPFENDFFSVDGRRLPPALPTREAGPSALPDAQPEAPGFFSSLGYIGQIGGTYLVFSGMNGMILIDQHAAHERILFEKLKEADSRRSALSQALLIPEIVNLSSTDYALISEYQDVFATAGIELTLLGGDSVAIKSLPRFVQSDEGALIKDILAEVSELGKVESLDRIRDGIFASIACKGAVKAHEKTTPAEVMELCRDLDRIPNSASCPHGRPVYIEINLRELEKLFKRRT